MILGMSVETFTFIHVVLSLVCIMTGLIVVALMLQNAPIAGWNAFFLVSAILTSVTGFFFFPISGMTPAQVVGVISIVALAVAVYAMYGRNLKGPWRGIYAGTVVFALYLNCFVAVVQSFNKFAYLNKFAPTGSEPAFAVTQLVVLVALAILGIAAVRRYRPVD
jgi:hypothetical protein